MSCKELILHCWVNIQKSINIIHHINKMRIENRLIRLSQQNQEIYSNNSNTQSGQNCSANNTEQPYPKHVFLGWYS